MNLVHFSARPITKPLRSKRQSPAATMFDKPRGFWVSDEDDYGWKRGCLDNDFGLNRLRYAHGVTLIDGASILYLRSAAELDAFTVNYRTAVNVASIGFLHATYYGISWQKVSKEYQGIIITPYIWRMSLRADWYYGWDCASDCIWDVKAIKSVELLNRRELKLTRELEAA
jgi:hypothetical protein